MEQNQGSSLFEMEIDTYAQGHINSVSKWGKFISIVGLIFLGIMLLLLLIGGARILDALSGLVPGMGVSGVLGIIIAILLIFFGLYGAWLYFLLRASSLFKRGLATRNTNDLADGFAAMRNFFTISIVITVLGLLFTIYSLLNF